jgi:hypothetical protein
MTSNLASDCCVSLYGGRRMLQYIEDNFPVTKEANLVEKHMRDIIESKIGSLLMANNIITNEQILTFAKKIEEQEIERNKK